MQARQRRDVPPAPVAGRPPTDRFRVIEVSDPTGEDVGHDAEARTGSLADALSAQHHPEADRSRAVVCGDLDAARARREQRRRKP